MISPELVVAAPLPASIEILPKQAPSRDKLGMLLPTGTRVYLTDIGAPGANEEMLVTARILQDIGCIPVPHLAARRVRSREKLETHIAGLTEHAGVKDVLVIGGDVSKASGPYASTMALLETGLLDRFGIKDIAVAGHPESPLGFTETSAIELLKQKKAFADRTGAHLRIVTQFGFDPARAMAWSENLREIGIDVPVHIGVAGPAKLATLIKYATRCGVGNSFTFLKKRADNIFSLATRYSPEMYVVPIEQQLSTLTRPAISQIHIFPFGGLETASDWLRSRGSW